MGNTQPTGVDAPTSHHEEQKSTIETPRRESYAIEPTTVVRTANSKVITVIVDD